MLDCSIARLLDCSWFRLRARAPVFDLSTSLVASAGLRPEHELNFKKTVDSPPRQLY
ncbi:hypothetical protein RB8697 [Rhodopirellula baltica SH 1]|uniref:Uncharacterized protein n=1 Tax=Rhodopirellula baltica (strain DSM 10527 / NCIMB 13988 / SH1) TaxID=243090 RepID=Q7UMP3_RHOBA|nr:hypothetical protein RB8697 [Rhodopirellula baltica SH 1]